MLRNTRCLVVSLDEEGRIARLDCPWGEWTLDILQPGRPLPPPLDAVLAAAPADCAVQYFPYIYLQDDMVADVYVLGKDVPHSLILRDVSDMHRAELKFQQKAYEVSLLLEKQAELNRKLEAQRAELERANQAKSRFIASMSHEFRSPITSIMGQAELLARADKESELPAAIQRASWHLLTLVENLLEQARLGEGIHQLSIAAVDLATVLTDMRLLFTAQAEAKGIRFSVADPPRSVALSTDELRLRQVLINLIGNAIRYTAQGRVELTLRVHGDALEFVISDTGPGIAAEDRERIFEPFQRLDPGRQSGAGLGLAVSSQLVRAMGGQLRVDSEVGQGSTFRVSLPRGAAEGEPDEVDLHGLRVLLVDDDPDVLALYEVFLEGWGIQVTRSSGYREALEHMADGVFDLALSDLQLQDGNGEELLERIRATQPECRTILMSGAGEPVQAIGRSVGTTDAYLQKPIPSDRLRATIASLAGRGPD